jgi:hypothetical protein
MSQRTLVAPPGQNLDLVTGDTDNVIVIEKLDRILKWIHGALDLAGLTPALGVVPDGVNGAIYVIEGDWANAGLSLGAMVPVFGQGVTTGKHAVKITRKTLEEAGEAGIKRGIKKETARTAAELVGKSGREAFGAVRFRGLVRHRKIKDLSGSELYKAFKESPYRVGKDGGNSSHVFAQLKNRRTSGAGVHTLFDVERLLNKGVVQEAKGGRAEIVYGQLKAIVDPKTSTLITVRPL